MNQSSVDQQLDGRNGETQRSDDINLLEFVYALVKNKWWIITVTLLGIFGGYIMARFKGPTWVAEVVIAPKETENQKTPNISSFGAFSGLVASQLNFGGNPSLEKIETLLNSRDFNARLIEKYDLLPSIYRYAWPKIYAENWDSSANDWKSTFRKPQSLAMGDFLKETFLKQITNNNLMTIKISSRDSSLSYTLANVYTKFLDIDIRERTRGDAKENVEYLEQQLLTIGDPLLREKIQSFIADEIEKMMVVSKEAFRVVDPIFIQKKFKEKRLFPLVFGTGLFFVMVILIIFLHTVSTSNKTDEDKILIEKIKKKLLF